MPEKLPAQQPKRDIAFGSRGIQVKTVADAWRHCQAIAKSEAGRGQKPEDIYFKLTYGMELGFSPCMAIKAIYVVKGRPALETQPMKALCMSTGELERCKVDLSGEGKTRMAACTVKRRDYEEATFSFSMADAGRANLLGKEPWQQHPDRMLSHRATSIALRDQFPDVLFGIYSKEEAEEIEPPQDTDYTVRESIPLSHALLENGSGEDATEVKGAKMTTGEVDEATAIQEVEDDVQKEHRELERGCELLMAEITDANMDATAFFETRMQDMTNDDLRLAQTRMRGALDSMKEAAAAT